MAVNINHQTDTITASGGTLNLPNFSGGLTRFSQAESTTSPNDTVSVDSLTAAAATTDADVAFVAKGTGATLAQVPTATEVGGNKRGIYATDLQKTRIVASNVASGSNSVITGGTSNTASGQYSVVCGGSYNSASNDFATISGGNVNVCSGLYATVGGGDSNVCSGNYGLISGGYYNLANASLSSVIGGSFGSTRGIIGYTVFPASYDPMGFGVQGKAQVGLLVLATETTGAGYTSLTSNSGGPNTTNQVILPNNSAYSFSGEVIAGVTGGGNTARWTINGAIKRGANAASTAMVGAATVTKTHNDAGAAAWTVDVTADTTNGGLSVAVDGPAGTTVRWVCKINTTEMSF